MEYESDAPTMLALVVVTICLISLILIAVGLAVWLI